MLFTQAVALSTRVVRITFNGVADATALNPANYVLAPQTLAVPPTPGVPVAVSSVSEVTGSGMSQFELTANDDLSLGVNYLITATGITGVTAPNNKIVFVAYKPPEPVGRDFAFREWIPRINWREDSGDLEKFISAVQEVGSLLLYGVDGWGTIYDPDYCAEKYLDILLTQIANPFDYFELSVIEKRRLVQLLLPIYRQKGTAPGIENAIRLFFAREAAVIPLQNVTGMRLGTSKLSVDWVLGYTGANYTFKVKVESNDGTIPDSRIAKVVDYMRAAHEHPVLLGALPSPTLTSATPGAPGAIALNWSAPPSGTPAGGYRLYWRTAAGVKEYNSTPVNVGAATTYNMTGVPSGQTRYFVVAAVDSAGKSGFESNERSATAV